jgi:formylglycine-generating enzyme required for sulfatase activity
MRNADAPWFRRWGQPASSPSFVPRHACEPLLALATHGALGDHEHGPEMVVVPAGSFTMGSQRGEKGRWDERQHLVTFARPFAVGK